MKNYKFLDVGCKTGKSFNIAKNFGYELKEGIGIDINSEHVNKFKINGFDAMVASATNIPFPDNNFELVIFNHVLEHLPNEEEGKKAFDECLRVCSKYVYLALPFFDEDAYLNSLNFKTYYSDWTGHTNRIHLSTICNNYLKDFKYEVRYIKEIKDSSCDEILPISAPIDSFEYNSSKHGNKKIVKFEKTIWREFSIIISK
jgi:ubiquinone/menaquinone biosynthesis C-methylase UbiE